MDLAYLRTFIYLYLSMIFKILYSEHSNDSNSLMTINRDNFPSTVKIYKKGQHHCGGVLVGKNSVLTAAMCITDSNNIENEVYTVICGNLNSEEKDLNYQKSYITDSCIHPKFHYPDNISMDDTDILYDIAMIKISPPFQLDIESCYPTDIAEISSRVRTKCNVTVLDRNIANKEENRLRYTQVRIIRFCFKYTFFVPKLQLCVKKKTGNEALYLDGAKGGPLYCNGLLEGIISYTKPDSDGSIIVLTKLSGFQEWLYEYMEANQCSSAIQIINETYFVFYVFTLMTTIN